MPDAPAFDFYPERWIAGTAGFSDAEQLAYLRLLCHQWIEDGLPDDLATLKRLGGKKGVTPKLLLKFPIAEVGIRRNARLETIRSEQRARIAKRSEQRRLAANARWGNGCGPHSDRNAAASVPQCGDDAAGMPTTHHPPPTPINDDNHAGASAPMPPVELEEAKRLTPGIRDEIVMAWYESRQRRDWVLSLHGRLVPITAETWREDLDGFRVSWLRKEKEEVSRRKRPGKEAEGVALTSPPSSGGW